MKVVRSVCRDEDDAAGFNRKILVKDANHPAALGNVVDLILRVRLLQVRWTNREAIDPTAKVRRPEELKVSAMPGVSLRDMEE